MTVRPGQDSLACDLVLKPELHQLVPLSDTTVWRLERAGNFPRRLVLGKKRVAWARSEVNAWLAERLAERRA